MTVPEHPIKLMTKVYKDIFPIVHHYVKYWREQAENIPNVELKTQALDSINRKEFHCEGGGILAMLSGKYKQRCVEFIVAYQTISDYLDNLCDRSTSLDPEDFRMLHQSMLDALTCGEPCKNYYQFREDQDDGGYLHNLVKTCQSVLADLNHYPMISQYLLELSSYYCDLQVHKHVKKDERVPRLENWFNNHKPNVPEMEWYEFSACTGSTLGIFCLVAYAFHETFEEKQAKQIRDSYFPYVQGLHILLDYLIDQEEDKLGGDLNFCSYYESEAVMMKRLEHFVQKADYHLSGIPHENFHKLINRGLLGVYLSDDKVATHKELNKMAKRLIKLGGKTSYFFYVNGRAYRTIQKISWRKSS
ncbi:tetraprenyl-beta-curcumene synthase family protein [Metabacillus malikii]|uniref:Tetraprenyl-beta-curcumene synthase n=1 Tax=Metabacillus malikii TaxID=1504265 RepID=A0ABT9ZH72_9BACI|nr:tetraprenyl-beta-curcumene synthase family protein [Metabacillus malikii]MDQ0231156.1 tetraprenyl-beta-curcumene synthase [Metabacillus malikii]